jgi:Prokaryotic N-terminal methylation motif
MNRRTTSRIASGTKSRPRRDGHVSCFNRARAFTLMEVMIAMAIFFMTVFAILELVATNLRNARLLETPRVDCGLVIADLCLATQLEEGTTNGDFGKLYPGYTWEQDILSADDIIPSAGTNGLFHVWYILKRPDGTIETNIEALMWKPLSKPVQH